MWLGLAIACGGGSGGDGGPTGGPTGGPATAETGATTDPTDPCGGPEVCNGLDDDCDGLVDAEDPGAADLEPLHPDADGDGAGAEAAVLACAATPGLVASGGDCDDADPARFPGAAEACDGADTDCDGVLDPQVATVVGGATFGSLADAVSAAAPGGTIRVCAGTWATGLEVTTDLTIEGVGPREAVVLTAGAPTLGGGGGPAITVDGAALRLAHVTVTGAGGPEAQGGALSARAATALTVEDCLLSANQGALGGGLLGPENGALVVTDSELRDNTALQGAGAVVFGGAFSRTVIAGNLALGAAGVLVYPGSGATLDLADTAIASNFASGCGGGLALGGDVAVSGGNVHDNTASCGGGVSAPDFRGTLTGMHLHHNAATGPYAVGGGLLADADADFALVDCLVEDNRADAWGAGLYLVDGAVAVTGGTLLGGGAGTAGGGAFVDGAGRLALGGVDLGTGASDNAPDDLGFAGGAPLSGLGAATTLTCDATGCVP